MSLIENWGVYSHCKVICIRYPQCFSIEKHRSLLENEGTTGNEIYVFVRTFSYRHFLRNHDFFH